MRRESPGFSRSTKPPRSSPRPRMPSTGSRRWNLVISSRQTPRSQLEHEVRREALLVSPDLLNEHSGSTCSDPFPLPDWPRRKDAKQAGGFVCIWGDRTSSALADGWSIPVSPWAWRAGTRLSGVQDPCGRCGQRGRRWCTRPSSNLTAKTSSTTIAADVIRRTNREIAAVPGSERGGKSACGGAEAAECSGGLPRPSNRPDGRRSAPPGESEVTACKRSSSALSSLPNGPSAMAGHT